MELLKETIHAVNIPCRLSDKIVKLEVVKNSKLLLTGHKFF